MGSPSSAGGRNGVAQAEIDFAAAFFFEGGDESGGGPCGEAVMMMPELM
jgi:hypothetical protein